MLWYLALPAWADTLYPGSLESPAYIAQIQAHTPNEVSDILHRLEVLLQDGQSFPSNTPLVLVLHGDEAGVFLRRNYLRNKALVDLAARLDAFDAVHIQICETWMRRASVSKTELPAFVDTIPYGPSQEKALLDQGYEYF